MGKEQLLQAIEARKHAVNRPNLRIKIKDPGKLRTPIFLENKYEREILKMINRMIIVVRSEIYPFLQSALRFNESNITDSKIIRKDDIAGDVGNLVLSTKLLIESEFPDELLSAEASAIAESVSGFNRKETFRIIKKMIGVNVFTGDPFLADQLAIFTKENVSLIRSISDRYFREIEEISFRGIRSGLRWEQVRNELTSRLGIAKNRAALIARDQVNKLNGDLTRLRHESLGIKKYAWQSAGDDRVRPQHEENDGQIFSYAKGDPEGNNPGDAINCRCSALPVLDKFITS